MCSLQTNVRVSAVNSLEKMRHGEDMKWGLRRMWELHAANGSKVRCAVAA